MRLLRGAVPPEERAGLARQAEDRLLDLDEVVAAGTVLLFYSFDTEVATKAIGERLLAGGKRLLLPYLTSQGMEAGEIFPGDPLLPTGYGPREPSRRTPLDPSEVDLVIAPGLAFDRRGFRLGYGEGHYDRYLTRLRPETIRIGLAFSIQLIDRIPEEPSDQKVHLVVTDAEVVDCRDGA
jgi:5-formyltetrahydrofolate cyclo-ligase